ncbi:unnamed protein product [Tilletia controversa]|uniref:Uncharacterized protein n=3 Tax=Tilletia TaxID=13289 RepID=A0A8X7MQ41_9BASI|nr:hypothetical protein CF336_g4962 [Tilletia laevis]KAE8194943.1 hypothetical protein CF328_g4591 [Tilletia controversa]KAE8256631.1 hypothetical protein A4X03_0g5216 [Tilletia caries]KAE8200439.1 hypothetical protein CF335_g3957 [Tilletia laevis]KAE8245510.1 hypothetical protein A4X06_0g5647 [Tilletia controversa]
MKFSTFAACVAATAASSAIAAPVARDLTKQPSGNAGADAKSGTFKYGDIEIAGSAGSLGADGHIAIGDLIVLSGGAGPKGASGVIYGTLFGDKSIGGHAGATGGAGHVLRDGETETFKYGDIEISGKAGSFGADGHVKIGDLITLSGGAGPKGASGVIYGDIFDGKSIGGHAGFSGLPDGHVL